jgi:enterochelin esterase-like enzyme
MPLAFFARRGIRDIWSVLAVLAATAASAQPGRLAQSQSSSRLVSDTVYSAALRGNLYGDSPNRAMLVYLPASYDRSPARRYPVVYLLHGFASSPKRLWGGFIPVQPRMDSLITAGAVHEMIVVMPDAQNALGGTFYINSAATGNWEDFIAHDLVRYIDGKYRTLARPESRGLAGLSMGGYGALAVGMRNAGTVFGAIYGMSPCCAGMLDSIPAPVVDAVTAARSLSDAARLPEQLRGLLAFAAAASPDAAAGPLFLDLPYVRRGDGVERVEATASRWNAYALRDMVPHHAAGLKRLRGLAFDVGRNDEQVPPSSVMGLDTVLTMTGVPHTFELFDGTHMSRADERFTQRVLPFFSAALVFGGDHPTGSLSARPKSQAR